MRFCASLADHLNHSYIKVYLSAVYSDPLTDCLLLQWLLRGIKQHQVSLWQQTFGPLCTIPWTSPPLTMSCCGRLVALAFLGFSEPVSLHEWPAVHLTIADLQVDSLTNLQSFKVFIKCANTNSFWQGVAPHHSALCWLYQTTFTFEGQVKVSHLFNKMAVLFQGPVYLHSCNLHYR